MENEDFNQIKNTIDNLLDIIIKDIKEILLNCDETDFYDYQTQILQDVEDFEEQIYAIENERFKDSYQLSKEKEQWNGYEGDYTIENYVKYESKYYKNY
ncbi:hypothetical protein SAMN02745163_01048 [Clostridium cavendishii DSM 21758]|uniref:Uncharacterized protein n=1 Tax=Clostridium cavendishii DSM 21758 TaxID=1121302 RepID=A0A1M6F696_9CLOT|nr:hypothetical protein [Clostridium cavendishii]SHI93254.1 hypothetical protein SAMN02745163_01048 [Clostridium cavendishii DSM 21758]